MNLFLSFSFILLPQISGDDLRLFSAAKVFTATEEGVIDGGIVAVAEGKIVWVGKAVDSPYTSNHPVENLGNVWLVPGLHEPHCHVAGSLGDLNDNVGLTNPGLDAYSTLDPWNPLLRDAVAGGVTTALLIPGSGSNMGGFGSLVKTSAKTVAEMVVRDPGSLKVAQAGNPERWGYRVGRALMNWNTRRTLQLGLEHARAIKTEAVEADPRWRNFPGLESGEVPVSVHTQIYQVVLQTLTMLKRDLGLQAFVDHGTFDGYKTGFLAAELGVPVMNGPRQVWHDRSRNRIQGCAAGWAEAEGLLLGYNTDAPVIPQEELPFQAAMGVRYGAGNDVSALEGMTANAAQALLCEDISGSLRPGLDADLVAWTGSPVDPRSWVQKAWVRGELVYDAEKDGRRF